MGRQVNFYLGPEDERMLFEDVLHSYRIYLVNAQRRKEVIPVDALLTDRMEVPFALGQVAIAMLKPIPVLSYRKGNGRELYLDDTDSETLQYSRCTVCRKELQRGRFWFSPLTWNGKPKDPKFVGWADGVLRRTKRKLKLMKNGNYIGAHARRLIREKQIVLDYVANLARRKAEAAKRDRAWSSMTPQRQLRELKRSGYEIISIS